MGIFIDHGKAFDTVDRDTLLKNLTIHYLKPILWFSVNQNDNLFPNSH